MSKKYAALVIGLAGASNAIAGSFDFKAYEFRPAPSEAAAVAVGDVTGDGRNDVILATKPLLGSEPDTEYGVMIYAQKPNGSLAAPVKYQYTETFTLNVELALGDINNDSLLDIVVNYDYGITVLMANGSHGFTKKVLPTEGWIVQTQLADIDGDGLLDFVSTYDPEDPQTRIFYSDGAGGIKSVTSLVFGGHSPRVADVNGDKRPDLVFAKGQAIWVYPHDQRDSFLSGIAYTNDALDSLNYSSIAIGDFNRDGRNDILSVVSAYTVNYSVIWPHYQSVNGTMALAPSFLPGSHPIGPTLSIDLDQDGLQDLLASQASNGLGRYMQAPSGLSPEQLTSSIGISTFDALAAGDLNGDGCIDAALAVGEPNGLVTHYGQNCYEPWSMANRHDGDFDGDGKSDILWHNNATGGSVIWKSGDSASRISMTRITDTGWTIAGTGDFNGDGRSDVLWHHAVTGANVIWRSADYAQQQSITRVTDLNWEIVGIGDFNGDDRDDILWRHKYTGANTIWKSGYSSKAQNLSSANLDWKVVGTGDFDGNGRADILWRHIATGQNALWRNANYTDARNLSTVPDTYWQVAGIGDFDHDGRADILWHHAIDGQNAIWHAGSYATSRTLTQITDLKWKIAGIGDYDHDGRSDILWRHSGTGSNTIWRAAESASLQPVTGVTDMNWKVAR